MNLVFLYDIKYSNVDFWKEYTKYAKLFTDQEGNKFRNIHIESKLKILLDIVKKEYNLI